jgi:hypothetical protein
MWTCDRCGQKQRRPIFEAIPISYRGTGGYGQVCSMRCARAWTRHPNSGEHDYQSGFGDSHPFVTEDWYTDPDFQ